MFLNQIDNFICLVFLGDFTYNVITAKNKLGYLKWGWIDLLSSIPNIQILRWGRFVRIIRIIRILRGIRSTKLILKFLFANRAKGIFVSVGMISFVLIVFSSIAILNYETSPESNIQTASDALWWSFVTITTVGYGDFYPTTISGRIIAAVLMVAGVGLFGTFTAYIASFFIQHVLVRPAHPSNEPFFWLFLMVTKRAQIKTRPKERKNTIDRSTGEDIFNLA